MHDRLPEAMTHDDLLLALLYDELSPAQAAAAREKLATEAPESLERLAEWRSIREVVAELPELEPDPQIHYDIIREARRAVDAGEKRSRWWPWLEQLTLMPALAGLLLVVLAAGLTLRLSTDFEQSADEALPGLTEQAAAPAKKAAPGTKAEEKTPVAAAEAPAPRGGEAEPAADAPVEEPAAVQPSAPLGDLAAARETDGREAANGEGRGGLGDGDDAMADAKDLPAYGAENEKGAGRSGGPDAPEAPKVRIDSDLESGTRARSKAKAKAKAEVSKRAEEAQVVDEKRPATSERKASVGKKLRMKSPPPEAKPSKPVPRKTPPQGRRGGGKAELLDDLFSGPGEGGGAPADGAAPRRANREQPSAGDMAFDTEVRPTEASAEPAPQAAPRPESDKAQIQLGTATTARDDDEAQRKYAPPPPATPAPDPPAAEPAPEPTRAQPQAPIRTVQTAGVERRDEDVAEAEEAVSGDAVNGTLDRRATAGGDTTLDATPARADEDRLSRARILRNRGLYREAVDEYEAFLSENRGQSGLDRVWFEAAESYRALGQTDRAMQLYRLVAGGDSSYARQARDRIASLTAGQAEQAKEVPQAAPAKARQQAEPDFEAVEAVERE